ncbi:MAG: hypothetical protein A3J07_02280 [Candidatus Doudnabacteria bacterium RIFCSPLOWO2_02_FULL_49_13]|uniref:D-lactate dehydrogenase (cytochrome) n=1 Tax=Candidatus Doudnabacteria bacterium RIFCSPHIGHO2_12_FULL_48_16 TaxID=1817838 RepID=A0A1F5PLK4_9BACT|nr:MAG: hypothetical protein A3B77_00435 [Candidatus Doudnabacteria bacterium RIFCSPHIGHO2_02_FULL_49_24]OGE90759.1 MAG: hypothetical protein A3E29_01380 [Candidatus Doudnabacteria bacterium RIFCSPHIGHO2_12_FULL_48_16]OGE97670.1 MAG: hypothetical protein A2990_02630 [Candidatus Doudnabacteria bacterium RIFCSPLOWO2_01_FULL_49_40]OGF02622.1 MAG: hypothetical protein A3J07_02280 [Candidatus Doudnabacteria bacterium RIFCSPLOWO2_02_FULL_49_13]
MDLEKQIQNIIKGEVKTDAATLAAFSRDASLYQLMPKVVVFPHDVADLKALVKFASSESAAGRSLSLTPRAGGSDMSGGALTESIAISMTKYFNRVKKFGKDFAVVEPGVYYRDFEKLAAKKGLLLPSFPASKEVCTLGGMVANNAGGELNLLYGKTERYILELKMVCADGQEHTFKSLTAAELEQNKRIPGFEGQLYRQLFDLIHSHYDLIHKAKPRVSKNSAGYYLWNVYNRDTGTFDIPKLLVGSQGTLGIITEIKFRLVKPNKREHLLVLFINDLRPLPAIVNHLLKFHPQSIESYDEHTFKVAMKLLPEIVARLRGGVLKLFFGFLPELWMVVRGGVPKLIILVEFSSNSEAEALANARKAQQSLKEFNIRTKLVLSQAAAEKYWVIRRESFSLLRHHVRGLRTAPFIDDFVVRPEFLPEFLPKLYEILDKYKLLFTVAGHVGDGNFHIIPLMKVGEPRAAAIIRDLGREVYDLVFLYQGSMSGEHNDGLVRGPYLEQMYGPQIFQLFKQTKLVFDPAGIFNPGKKTEATLEFGLQHLDF